MGATCSRRHRSTIQNPEESEPEVRDNWTCCECCWCCCCRRKVTTRRTHNSQAVERIGPILSRNHAAFAATVPIRGSKKQRPSKKARDRFHRKQARQRTEEQPAYIQATNLQDTKATNLQEALLASFTQYQSSFDSVPPGHAQQQP